MKKNLYLKIFLLLQVIMLVLFLYDYTFGLLSLGIIILYELYYIMIKYKSRDSSIIKGLSFFMVFGFLAYEFFTKDPSNLVLLVSLFFNQLFIFSYYKENKLFKRGTIDLLRYLYPVMCVLYMIFGYYLEIAFFLFIFYPLLFINYNKSRLDNIILWVCSLYLFIVGDKLLLCALIFYLVVLSIIYAFSKSLKNLKYTIPLLVIGIVSFISTSSSLYVVNSKIFENESIIIKLIKSLIGIFPLMYYLVHNFIVLKKNKYYFNNDLAIISLSIIGYFVLVLYARLDIPPFVVVASSYLLVLFSKFQKDKIKSINDNKITIFALHLGYGGIEKYISSLCQMFDKFDIEIVSTYKVLKKPVFDYGKAEITYLINDKPNREEFRRARERKNIFLIIKEGIKAITLLYKKRAYNIEAIEKTNSKYIITTRDFHNELVGSYADDRIIKIATEHNYHNDDQEYIDKVVTSVYNTDYFVLVSENLRKFYSSITNTKCVFIPNCIDEIPGKNNAKGNTLVSVGRFSKEKAQKDLIMVLKLVVNEIKNVKLYLVGDGEERRALKDLVKKENLEDYVVFTGFLNREELSKKLKESKVFVTTSLTESFGLAEIEAQSYNIPVVAFDSADGLKELLKDDAGVLIKKRDKKEMADAIIKLLEDDKYYKKIANNGLENAKKYDIKNVKNMWNNIIK